ncbi:hypothetical protein [Jeongeupia naejangsanensis]|uniref:Uncharacterized protein n=1 Tax=Jeongeupia naejangsanensis TaxID=613195 RepID=A0ABS2BJ01_9NEIS|nr:hypothetical protein [Jeongeupia naejangsanensis]MBM3114966.1 hypothetical protein [Jeongeupia naejangsanensis]
MLSLKHASWLPTSLLLTACVSSPNFNGALEKPAKQAATASSFVADADKDLLTFYTIGLAAQGKKPSPELLCKPAAGPMATASQLMVFSDSMQAVSDVAEAPDGTTYAAYIKKMSANAAAINANPADDQEEIENERNLLKARIERCQGLAQTDFDPKSSEFVDKGVSLTPLPGLASFLALNAMIKEITALAEKTQREAAIRKTMNRVVKSMNGELEKLKAKPSDGAYVLFRPTTSTAATMNETSLGATVNLRRWMLAQKINAQWVLLSKLCKSTTYPTECMQKPMVLETTDALIGNIYAYRSAAAIDPDAILKRLGDSIAKADASSKELSMTTVGDTIITIGESLGDLKDSYEGYRKTRTAQ